MLYIACHSLLNLYLIRVSGIHLNLVSLDSRVFVLCMSTLWKSSAFNIMYLENMNSPPSSDQHKIFYERQYFLCYRYKTIISFKLNLGNSLLNCFL